MIYFIYGTDVKKSRKKMHEILRQLSDKRPNSEIFKITTENWQNEQLDEFLSAQGLFEKKYIVVLDFLLGKKETKDFILEKLDEMQGVEHWFLILDGKVDLVTVKKIEKFSYKTQEFIEVEKQKESPIIFTITDKLLTRNKKQLWTSFISLVGKGIAVEEIHGVLFWAVKNMILALRTKNQKESELTPFQYSKAVSGAKNYTLKELQKMSGELMEMVHLVRTGKGDMEIMLEKWVLGV